MIQCHCEERSDAASSVTPRSLTELASSLTLLAMTLVMTVSVLIAPARAQERVLNIYNWTDYIDPVALERFQKETGITVHYDVFDSLETLEAKMLAGHSGYDVVVPTNEPTFSRLIQVGALARHRSGHGAELEESRSRLMRRVESSDPGNAHGAIYLWGIDRAGHDHRPREAACAGCAAGQLGPAVQAGECAKRIAPCGITMMDSAIDVIPVGAEVPGQEPGQHRSRRPRRGGEAR